MARWEQMFQYQYFVLGQVAVDNWKNHLKTCAILKRNPRWYMQKVKSKLCCMASIDDDSLLQHAFIQEAKSVSILNNMIQEALNIMEEESAREENEV